MAQAAAVFCEVCGKGINILNGETPYKCSECSKVICDVCCSRVWEKIEGKMYHIFCRPTKCITCRPSDPDKEHGFWNNLW